MLAEAKVLLGADDQLWLTRTDDMIETQMLLGHTNMVGFWHTRNAR